MTRIVSSAWYKLWRTNKTAPSNDEDGKGFPKKLLGGVNHADSVAQFLQSRDFELQLIRHLELKPQKTNSCSGMCCQSIKTMFESFMMHGECPKEVVF